MEDTRRPAVRCENAGSIVQHAATTVPHALDYLIFDYSEDEDGNGSWDAMASAPAARLPALVSEIESILQWAHLAFPGRCGPLEEGNDWDFALSAQDDAGQALAIRFDARSRQLQYDEAEVGHTTLTLTLTGNAAFADGLRDAFEVSGNMG